jgi:hypothetical protein
MTIDRREILAVFVGGFIRTVAGTGLVTSEVVLRAA